jgi:formylglycine-generating enzyme required for sulfatase activity
MTEVTRAQWRALGGDDQGGDPRLPATAIDWFTAGALLRRWGMALPTEAQWEYACRAGTSTPWWKGDTFADADLVGNFGDALQRVALLPANAFGLYDVHGNAAEWCADQKLPYAQCKARAGDGLRTAAPPVVAPEARVVRGGSAVDGPKEARSSARGEQLPQTRSAMIGVRPVRAVVRS